jgi:dynein light chain LC8-type
MTEEMAHDAVDFAVVAYLMHKSNEEIAKSVALEFDNKYHSTWHCIVGPDYDSLVHPEANNYISFQIGEDRFELWKSH